MKTKILGSLFAAVGIVALTGAAGADPVIYANDGVNGLIGTASRPDSAVRPKSKLRMISF